RIDGQPLSIPRREFQLLALLAANAHRTISREQVVDHLWGMDFEGGLRVVDLYIDRLRKRLRPAGDRPCDWRIRTTRGIGYRLEVDP
ncbi:MAG: winged helix-turn-helix domain-containing protein, partial [Clostridia bacterium]|nr:winged helix-turn-helix domain-containing protein [Clostridia bacterium]